LNTGLAIVGLFVGFIVYMFTLATILTGFPPDASMVKVPSDYTRLLGAGAIVFALIAGSLAVIDAKNKISAHLKWSIIWLTFAMLSVVSFILYFLFYDIMGIIGYGNIFWLIAWISVALGALFYRKLELKVNKKIN
jgi:hypothetical protein